MAAAAPFGVAVDRRQCFGAVGDHEAMVSCLDSTSAEGLASLICLCRAAVDASQFDQLADADPAGLVVGFFVAPLLLMAEQLGEALHALSGG